MQESLSTGSLLQIRVQRLGIRGQLRQLSRPFIKGQARQPRRMFPFSVRSVSLIARRLQRPRVGRSVTWCESVLQPKSIMYQ